MITTIDVTEKDLIEGVRGYCKGCPVALAAMRATGGHVWVATTTISLIRDGSHYSNSFPLPIFVSRNIRLFDEGCAVSPFSFKMDL